jgi:REP-associated tyrosine transposase
MANQEIGVPGIPGRDTAAGAVWRSRGYLPHFDNSLAIQHVTFHLADSLPKAVLERLEAELRHFPDERREIERRKRIDAWMDAGHGSQALREPAIAGMVQSVLLFFDSQRYRLLAWAVMPNHVHALFEPIHHWTVAKIVASWKKFSAKEIREWRRANGDPSSAPVWHREYWDRYIRDERQFVQTIQYIHSNPVKAGLVAKAEAWRWSSAFPGNANLPIG